jgi:hypothetical protein
MKTKSVLLMALMAIFFFVSCKKESNNPQLIFNVIEGTANASGEYTITGHISSAVRLDKVVLTKESQPTPFLLVSQLRKTKMSMIFPVSLLGLHLIPT